MTGTHQPFPVRNAQTKQRPFPRRGLCCPVGSSGTTAASDALPAPAHFPVLPVIGRDAPTTSTQAAGPGRASPVPAATLRAFRAPYAGKSLGAAIQALHPFRGLRPDNPGSALPRPRQRGMGPARQASLDATDRSLAPPKGAFDAGLRRRAFPPDAASLLPGLLAATRTGLPPAGNDELMLDHLINKHHQLWAHAASPCEQHCRAPLPRGRTNGRPRFIPPLYSPGTQTPVVVRHCGRFGAVSKT